MHIHKHACTHSQADDCVKVKDGNGCLSSDQEEEGEYRQSAVRRSAELHQRTSCFFFFFFSLLLGVMTCSCVLIVMQMMMQMMMMTKMKLVEKKSVDKRGMVQERDGAAAGGM